MVAENILDIDVGNTRSKWLMLRDAAAVTGVFDNTDMTEALRALRSERIARIRVACVAKDALKRDLIAICLAQWSVEPEFAASSIACAGIRNGYGEPHQLGVDRWLAALAAWHEMPGCACLIVDAGSALTLDTIDEHGVFLGGYIIPGFGMMQRALLSRTGQITCATTERFANAFTRLPASTEHAVQNGAALAVCASTQKAIENFLQRWPRGRVRITGGDGLEIAKYLAMIESYEPDLVLRGLSLALP